MIAVVQRVSRASVRAGTETLGKIGGGFLALVAVERGDNASTVAWMASRLAGLRVFPGTGSDASAERPYELDVRQSGGQVLLVSNFTVAASCDKGRRPSLDSAAPPEVAQPLYELLCEGLRAERVSLETGRFGANMQVELVNDGPVTFLVTSRWATPAAPATARG